MGTNPVQSHIQGRMDSSSKDDAKALFLSMAGPYTTVPMVPMYMDILKDGRKLIMRPTKDDRVASNWLRTFVGVDVTVNVPHLGFAWTSKPSYRKGQGYVYIRVPAHLKKYFMPLWQAGVPIPVVVTIPPAALSSRFAEGVVSDE